MYKSHIKYRYGILKNRYGTFLQNRYGTFLQNRYGTFLQNASAVVCPRLGVEDALGGKAGVEHVLRVDLAPQVAVVLGIVPH